jgi:hypothetical protein
LDYKYKNESIMKILNYSGVIIALLGGAQLLSSCSGYVVATGPPPPMMNEVIVVAPSPRHVWMPGYYSYNRGNYVFINGSYGIPPRGRTTYIQGGWRNTPRGYRRDKGHWN